MAGDEVGCGGDRKECWGVWGRGWQSENRTGLFGVVGRMGGRRSFIFKV